MFLFLSPYYEIYYIYEDQNGQWENGTYHTMFSFLFTFDCMYGYIVAISLLVLEITCSGDKMNNMP